MCIYTYVYIHTYTHVYMCIYILYISHFGSNLFASRWKRPFSCRSSKWWTKCALTKKRSSVGDMEAREVPVHIGVTHKWYCCEGVCGAMVDLIANGWELQLSSDDDDVRRPRTRPHGIYSRTQARRIRDRILQQHNMMPQHTGAAQHTGASQCEERLNKK